MPIHLTTPWDPGNFDSGNTYPRAKIMSFNHHTEYKLMSVVVDFGDVVEGLWVSGSARSKEKTFLIQGEAYEALIADEPEEGETTYDAVKRALYTYLIENVLELDGTIE